jgi:hypothetical protein
MRFAHKRNGSNCLQDAMNGSVARPTTNGLGDYDDWDLYRCAYLQSTSKEGAGSLIPAG